MNKNTEELYEKLGYTFEDCALIRVALTHRSFGQPNNERLEFLGDAILNMVIAEALYKRCPEAQEGELSRFRAGYVRGDALADLAKQFDLGEYIYLGSGELKSGGRTRNSILADALEAVMGALFLEAGFETCRDLICQWFFNALTSPNAALAEKDPKTLLQEYLQARQYGLPQYTVDQTLGDAHSQLFVVSCHLIDLNCSAQGEGSSRRKAEQMAAKQCLKMLQDDKSS